MSPNPTELVSFQEECRTQTPTEGRPREDTVRRQPTARPGQGPREALTPGSPWILDFQAREP